MERDNISAARGWAFGLKRLSLKDLKDSPDGGEFFLRKKLEEIRIRSHPFRKSNSTPLSFSDKAKIYSKTVARTLRPSDMVKP